MKLGIGAAGRGGWVSGWLLVIALLAILHGFRPGRVLVPTDHLMSIAPWKSAETPGARPDNPLLLDQPTQFVPWMTYAVERLRRGEIPLWNPYSQLGAPFVGNGQSAIFYPTNWLHVLFPPSWSWTLSAWVRLIIAGFGAFHLARRYQVSKQGALLSGLAFMLCGFNIVWLNHAHMNVIPWLPWSMLAMLRLIDRPSPRACSGCRCSTMWTNRLWRGRSLTRVI